MIGPGARRTDPETSLLAAERSPLQRDTDRARALAAHKNHPDGLTDFELATILGRQQTSAGKRRGELRDMGYVEASKLRRAAPSGSPAIVWRITTSGAMDNADTGSRVKKPPKERPPATHIETEMGNARTHISAKINEILEAKKIDPKRLSALLTTALERPYQTNDLRTIEEARTIYSALLSIQRNSLAVDQTLLNQFP